MEESSASARGLNMIKFRTIITHRLAELNGIKERQLNKISDCNIITALPRLKRKLKEIQDLIDLNNEFYKLVERAI